MTTKQTKATKKASDETLLKQLGIKLEPELLREFEQIALSEDRTLSQLGRIVIRDFVQRRKSQMVAA